MSLKTDLEGLDVGQVSTDAATLQRASADASIFRIRPKAVVYARSSADIRSLVRFVVAQNHELRIMNHESGPTGRLSLTVRSAGTDMTGGPLSSSIVVDVTTHLTGITHIGSNSFTALPGTPFRDIEVALAARGLMFPAYPASKAWATIGGMVANNAGGEKTLRYGKVERYVRSLKAVLADGNEYEFRRLATAEVEQKLRQANFEGEVYRELVPMLVENWSTVSQAKPAVTKNSSGYALWNVYNPADGSIDLAQLLIGSQGTLGILTEITLDALPIEHVSRLLAIYPDSLAQLGEVTRVLRALGPTSLEFVDAKTLRLAARSTPEVLPSITHQLTHGFPRFLVLAEFTGHQEQAVEQTTIQAQTTLQEMAVLTRPIVDTVAAERYWSVRRGSYASLRNLPGRGAIPFIDDVVVHPDALPDYLAALEPILAEFPEFECSITGHAGDGNLHLLPLADLGDPAIRTRLPELTERIHTLTLAFRGSLSGEHNDGLIRGPYLEAQFGLEIMDLFHTVKNAFDPRGIFNPHKKAQATQQYSTKHMKRDN